MVETMMAMETRRAFSDPDIDEMYYIDNPTADDVRGAEWEYSKTYSRSLDEGILVAAEMIDMLTRRGLIGPEFEERQRELSHQIGLKVLELESADTDEEKRRLAIELANLREELFNWNQRLNGPMSNTCEQMADDARLEYITSCIVQHEDGSRVWDSYNAYKTERRQSLSNVARFEVMLFLQGLDSDFLDKTPEAVAFRELEEKASAKAEQALAEMERQAEEARKASEVGTEVSEENASDESDVVEDDTKKKTNPRRKTTKNKKSETESE